MIRFACLLTLLGLLPSPVSAQDPVLVGTLAPILMAEDRRQLDTTLLSQAMLHPDAVVRRVAVTSVGRIGDRKGVGLLLPRLADRDPGVVATTFFALGLLRDSIAAGPIIDRLRQSETLSNEALTEAATALARIGGPTATRMVRDIIGDVGELTAERRQTMRPLATLGAWHLGTAAPIEQLLAAATDTSAGMRWRALYSLGRLQAPNAGGLLVGALHDPTPIIRETAAKSLTRRYVQTASLDAGSIVAELTRVLSDRTPGVRINALESLATFGDQSAVRDIIPLLVDEDRLVRIAAAASLGAIGGADAITALARAVTPDANDWGVRQAAFLALARIDSTSFAPLWQQWVASPDPFDRLTALDVAPAIGSEATATLERLTNDPDPRVQARALGLWRRVDSTARIRQDAAARRAWQSESPELRIAALRLLAPSPTDPALDLLIEAWTGGGKEIREAVLQILAGFVRRDPGVLDRLAAPSRRVFLERPADSDLRRTAARLLPALGEVWGAVTPIETGRTLEDYRRLTAQYLLATTNPRVTIEVDRRGDIEIELLPRDAPLTVANFLRLVDRRYFDNGRWHRVVPNFVIQDGDPTGTGSGGPGWTIRDEINRYRYDVPMLGMAHSGPDTGGSQWFINLSPQPHLDGGYTIFGKVVGSNSALRRVLPGDHIRSIHRSRAN